MIQNLQDSRGGRARTAVPGVAHTAIAGAIVTPLLLVSLRILSPELDPSYRMISEYAVGRYGWLLSLMFVAWGISSGAAAMTIRPHVLSRAGKMGVTFLVVAGFGQALAAVFDIRHDILHNLGGAMGMLGLPVAAILISVSLGRNPEWSPVRRQLLVIANLTWISVVLLVGTMVLMMVTFIHVNGGLPAQPPATLPRGVIALVGWANRLMVVVDCAWVVAVAGWALHLRETSA